MKNSLLIESQTMKEFWRKLFLIKITGSRYVQKGSKSNISKSGAQNSDKNLEEYNKKNVWDIKFDTIFFIKWHVLVAYWLNFDGPLHQYPFHQ